MNFKKCLWSIALAFIFAAPVFATTSTTSDEGEKTSKALTEIKSLIEDMDLDLAKLDQQTVKVHFMITATNEIVVLKTNNPSLDKILKFGLNYKELKNSDLEINKIYILPVSFKAENT